MDGRRNWASDESSSGPWVDDRPAEPGELAGDGDRDDRAALAALGVEPAPDAVQPLLGLPGDRDHRLLLAVLAALERGAEPGWAAVVPGRLDQQPAGVPRAGLGDVALAAALAGAVLARHQPEVACTAAWDARTAAKSPTSTASPTAESVSIPRRQRSRATSWAHGELAISSPIAASSVSRRITSASIAPTYSDIVSCAPRCPRSTFASHARWRSPQRLLVSS